MKSLILSLALFCGLATTNVASADDRSADSLSGRVQAVYVRLDAGVFREAQVGQRPAEVWVEVKTYDLADSRERGAVLLIRTRMPVERGDIVSFRQGEDAVIPIAPMPAESSILAVTAKRGSALALMYGSASADSAF